jgi:transposase
MPVPVVGVDLSKSVFQLSVADAKHRVIERKRLSRTQFHRFLAQTTSARLVMEACGTSNYWARTAQLHGHEVKLLHAKYVKAYVRRTKTDAADADALVLADGDSSLLPIPIKSEELQALQGLHRIREQWKRARTARICEARALLAEFGLAAPLGARGIGKKLTLATEQAPALMQPTLLDLIQEIGDLEQRLKRVDHALAAYASTNSDVQVLLSIQGVGITIATAFVARVPSIYMFKRGRSFSSWLGLTCREYSSGQTRRLSRITKQGDRYLRTMMIHGARAALMAARRKAANDRQLTRLEAWAVNTQSRIGHNKATVALANKMARIMWAVWTRHEAFDGDNALRFAA